MGDGVWSGGRRVLCAATALFALLCAAPARAQGVAETVAVTAHVGVEGEAVHVMVRVPLSLLGGADFPVRDNTIDQSRAQPAIQSALRAVREAIVLSAGGTPLQPFLETGRLSLPSDRSFDSYQDAARHLTAPPDGTEIYAGQGYFDAHFQYPAASSPGRLALHAAFMPDAMRAPRLTVRYRPPQGELRSWVLPGGSGDIALDPTRLQTMSGFLTRGARWIASHPIHLLFLLALLLPARRARDVFTAVAAFVGWHSVASIAATWAVPPSAAWFAPLAATLTAATLLAIALANILFATPKGRGTIAAACGVAHGLAFSSALTPDLQFAGPHALVAVLSFNAGIVLSEAAVLVVTAAALPWLTRVGVQSRRGVILLSVLLGHFGWHQLVDDAAALWRSPWPPLDAAALLAAGRWAAVLLITIGIAKAMGRWFGSGSRRERARLTP
jgi:hypothetical protein